LQRLAGKIAIVTGAGQGIGAGIAEVFAAAGAHVIIATRSENGAQVRADLRKQGYVAEFFQLDVTDDAAVKSLIGLAIENHGRLDILVHNAAAFGSAAVDAFDPALYERMMNTNLRAAMTLSAAAVPHMKKQGQGRLLFTSSVTGPRVAMPGINYYAASKGGLNGFIRNAALELAPHRITVNGVEPGYILTSAMERLTDAEGMARMAKYIPAGHLGTPEDIGHAMLYLASDEAAYVTGQTIVVDGGSTLPESPFFAEDM